MNNRGSELPDKSLGTSGIEESSQKVVVTALEAPSQCGGMSDEFAVRATRSLAPSSCELFADSPGESGALAEAVPDGLLCFNKCPDHPCVGQARSVIELKVAYQVSFK